jgi:hypothetical protein
MYRVTNGQAIRLAEEKILRVSSTGMTDFNGQPINLPAGSMLTLDGRVVPMPSGIRFTDGSSATTDETPPPTTPANAGASADRALMPPLGGNPGYPDRGVTGENLSGLAPAANASAGGAASSQTTVTGTRTTTTGAASSNTGRSSGRDSAGGGTTDPTTGVILGPGTGLGTGIPVEGNIISTNPAGFNNTDPNAGNFNTRTTNPNAVPAKGPAASQPATTTSPNTNTGNSATGDVNKPAPAAGQSTNQNQNQNVKPSTSTSTGTSTGTTSGSGTSTNTNTGTSGR